MSVERTRPAWAEIDLGAIRSNVAAIRSGLNPGVDVIAVVKANAYGHGDVECARAALDAGATRLGVILVDEGVRLRAAGIDAPIVLMHEPPAERIDEAIAADLTPTVFTEAGAAVTGEAAERAGKSVAVHVKLDTGLNRMGSPPDMLDGLIAALAKQSRVEVEAVFTHFAFADQPTHPFIDAQLARFADACDVLARAGVSWGFRHAANSAASLSRPDAHFDAVRPGIALYGLSPGPAVERSAELTPVMKVAARAAMVKRVPAGEAVSYGHTYRLERDATIVTIPVGYADGWPRALSNNASVVIGGRRYPAVGTVCMDSFMADLGDDSCDVGDEVVLIGAQEGPGGSAQVTADEHAAALNTINYEVVTRIAARIPRVYVG